VRREYARSVQRCNPSPATGEREGSGAWSRRGGGEESAAACCEVVFGLYDGPVLTLSRRSGSSERSEEKEPCSLISLSFSSQVYSH
jgi:hypothetical protein